MIAFLAKSSCKVVLVEKTDHDGYANDRPMETPNRFPQGVGNLAKNARFPHSHSQDLLGQERRSDD
jgi:hypothetical protein